MKLSETLEAMLEAGGTAEMMLAIVRAYEAAWEAEEAARRAKDAARTARRRALMPDDWHELRCRVFARDGYVCSYCGEPTEEPHCDHVDPLSRGGSNDLSNLTTACATCNASKGAKTLEEWRSVQ